MLWILALQFLLDPRVMLPPKASQVLRYLHRTQIRSQDVNQHGHAAHCDARRRRHTVKLLDAHRHMRGGSLGVNHFAGPARAKGQSIRRVPFEEFLLAGVEPPLDYWLNSLVFNVLITEGAVAKLPDQVPAALLRDGRQFEFRAPLAE